MNFADAINNMLNGKRMVRPTWGGNYLVILSGQSYIWMIGTSAQPPSLPATIYTPTIAELQATDWIVKTT